MKLLNKTPILQALALVLALSSSPALAKDPSGGSDAGNGGKGIVLPNGEVVLADPHFIQTNNCKGPETLHAEIRQYLIGAGQLLNIEGAGIVDKDPNSFLKNNVFNALVEYCFVDSLDPVCAESKWEPYKLPQGGKLVDVACTKGRRTYIDAALFANMNLRERSKLILHERLHAQAPEAPHDHINDFTDIVDTLVRIQEAEQTGSGLRLTPEEIARVERAPKRIGQLGLQPKGIRPEEVLEKFAGYRVAPTGGGWVSGDFELDPAAFVSLTSRIKAASGRVEAGAQILRSGITAADLKLGRDVRIADSRLGGHHSLDLAGDVRIEHSTVGADDVTMSGPVLIQDSDVSGGRALKVAPGVRVQHSATNGSHVSLKAGSSLAKSYLRGESTISLGADSAVEDSALEFGLWLAPRTRIKSVKIKTPWASHGSSRAPVVIHEGARFTDTEITLENTADEERPPVYLAAGSSVTHSSIYTQGRFVNFGTVADSTVVGVPTQYALTDGHTKDWVLKPAFAETWGAGLRVESGARIRGSTVVGIDVLWLKVGARIDRSLISTLYKPGKDQPKPKNWEDVAAHARSIGTAWTLEAGAALDRIETTWFLAEHEADEWRASKLTFARGIQLDVQGRICPKDRALTYTDDEPVFIGSLKELRELCDTIKPIYEPYYYSSY